MAQTIFEGILCAVVLNMLFFSIEWLCKKAWEWLTAESDSDEDGEPAIKFSQKDAQTAELLRRKNAINNEFLMAQRDLFHEQNKRR